MNWKQMFLESLLTEGIFIGEALVAQSGLPPGIKAALEAEIMASQNLINAFEAGV